MEPKALTKITAKATTEFVWQNIISRFGLPRVIVADLGKQFDSSEFKSYCNSKGIHVHYTSRAYPRANGLVEVTNRTIKKGLNKRLRATKSAWLEELYTVLWAYKTTPRTVTGETPYALAFGAEAVVLVEVEIPNYRIASQDKGSEGIFS